MDDSSTSTELTKPKSKKQCESYKSTQRSTTKQIKTEGTSRRIRSKQRRSRPPFVLDRRLEAVLADQCYEIKTKLGAGAFSEVYTAYDSRNQRECAVKIIDVAHMKPTYKYKFLPRELRSLAEARHRYIVRIHDIFRISNQVFIFMELAHNGDLSVYLKSLRKPLEERHACLWFWQIGSALRYLHIDKKIAHRDIKIDNILLIREIQDTLEDDCRDVDDRSNDDQACVTTVVVKLTDFGFSRQVDEQENDSGKPQPSQTFCGTRPYQSIQINQKRSYNPYAADIWALGVVLFAMLNNHYPFHYKNRAVMIAEQRRHANYLNDRFVAGLSIASRRLILAMFEIDETKRIDADGILKHEWIVKYLDQTYTISID